MIAVGDVIDPETGEVYLDSGETFTKEASTSILASSRHGSDRPGNDQGRQIILTSLNEDPTNTHEEALLKIYQRLRPGNPPQLEKAKELFREKFQDANRYRLGKVGRFRINRKFDQDIPEIGNDAAARSITSTPSATSCKLRDERRPSSTTSTTWAIAGCAPSTSWPPTSCARASSSCAAPCRNA